MIVLYELRLIVFVDISLLTWFIIYTAFFLFLAGILIVVAGRIHSGKQVITGNINSADPKILTAFFYDGGARIRYLILIFSVIGIFSGLQHWSVLIAKHGSIGGVLLAAGDIYRQRVEGDVPGVIPYLYILAYCAVILSGFYTAYHGKLSLYSILPIIAVIIKEMAIIGRAGIFFGLLEFITAFFLFRHILSKYKITKLSRTHIVFTGVVILSLAIVSSAVVKQFRGQFESYKSSSQTLRDLKDNPLVSPSIYLYLSSDIGVLTQYFEQMSENVPVGQNTLLPVYNVLSKFDLVEHPRFYPKGYFIPMWSNSATYLRDIHADFGSAGLFLVPFLLGLLTTYFWYRYQDRGGMVDLTILIFLFLIIEETMFYFITRSIVWMFSLFVLLLISALFERAQKNHLRLIPAS
jgi:oligosaccharide repeat unit polymerase